MKFCYQRCSVHFFDEIDTSRIRIMYRNKALNENSLKNEELASHKKVKIVDVQRLIKLKSGQVDI